MRDINKIEAQVYDVLVAHPHTRNCDDALYLELCMAANPIACNMSFKDVLEHRKDFGLPNIKSVERSRRKLQATHPNLRAVTEVEHGRMEEYEAYREYAKQV